MITDKLKELLPHREPFLFVDKILSVTDKEIIATTVFQSTNQWIKNSFPNYHSVPGTLLIESMVQSGGAGVRLLGIAEGIFVLTSIEFSKYKREVEYDKEIKYIITNIKISNKLIKQTGKAYIDNREVMEASWMTMKK